MGLPYFAWPMFALGGLVALVLTSAMVTIGAVVVLIIITGWIGRSNCVFYAMRTFWREGGFLVVNWSRNYPGPHARHTQDFNTFSEFVPPTTPRRVLAPWWFSGHTKQQPLSHVLGEECQRVEEDIS